MEVLSKHAGLWVTTNHDVFYSQATHITFICPMRFDSFPLDTQVSLASPPPPIYSASHLIFRKKASQNAPCQGLLTLPLEFKLNRTVAACNPVICTTFHEQLWLQTKFAQSLENLYPHSWSWVIDGPIFSAFIEWCINVTFICTASPAIFGKWWWTLQLLFHHHYLACLCLYRIYS